MNTSAPLTQVDPRPISPSIQSHHDPKRRDPAIASTPAFGMNPPQIPDHPASAMDVPRASNNYGAGPDSRGRDDDYRRGRDDEYRRGRDDDYKRGRDDEYKRGRDDDNKRGPGGNGGYGGYGYGQGQGPAPGAPGGYGPDGIYTAPQPPVSTMTAPNKQRDLPTLKSHCQYGLREYMTLQRQRRRVDGAVTSTSTLDLENKLKTQQGVIISDLMFLHGEVRTMVKAAEGNRWRRWIIGGAIASFVPLIRRIFRRESDQGSKDSLESSNSTEYAFRRAKGLTDYLKEGLLGNGSFAKIAFFVMAVLFIFQNEVSLRVAKTVQKRLRRLTARIERGDTDIDEKDLKMLDGWRWRVLMW